MPTSQLTLFAPENTFPEPAPCDQTVLCWGLGADSTAILVRMLEDPAAFGLRPDLSDLIVINAVTGMEWPDSVELAERHILPRLRAKRVRLVQIARGGHSIAKDGIEILTDTRTPTTIRTSGEWSLLLDLQLAGTIPMYGGARLCSVHSKGEPLDLWFELYLTGSYRHIIGFEAGETGRARVDTSYGKTGRNPWYPLINWGWDRPKLLSYLRERFGVTWPKSYCWACPYPTSSGSLPDHMARAARFPEQIVEAAVLEYTAQALNPLFTLYANSSLRHQLYLAGNTRALDLLAARLDADPWSVYEVRRVLAPGRSAWCRSWHGPRCAACLAYEQQHDGPRPRCKACRGLPKQSCTQRVPDCYDPQRKGAASRSVRRVGVLPRRLVKASLDRFASAPGRELAHTASVVDGYAFGFDRVVTIPRGEHFPAIEQQFVIAPANVPTKARDGFETAWRSARATAAPAPAPNAALLPVA
ncbi:hypothetical protein [Kitasatospora sp. NBC_01300]|uniref:hypothetical protein n=1 Tax=Kitasatospora sp. NBC_01300 TaxID=2903574 RepID=UPI002F90DBDB|nr:hypothetical protein OG556_40795 [Kitasatospora sp. NBC_01300]